MHTLSFKRDEGGGREPVCVDAQVCEEARCPNIGECWGGGEYSTATATIMVGSTPHPISYLTECIDFSPRVSGTLCVHTCVRAERLYHGFVFVCFTMFISIADGGHVHTWVQVLFCKDSSSARSIGPK